MNHSICEMLRTSELDETGAIGEDVAVREGFWRIVSEEVEIKLGFWLLNLFD